MAEGHAPRCSHVEHQRLRCGAREPCRSALADRTFAASFSNKLIAVPENDPRRAASSRSSPAPPDLPVYALPLRPCGPRRPASLRRDHSALDCIRGRCSVSTTAARKIHGAKAGRPLTAGTQGRRTRPDAGSCNPPSTAKRGRFGLPARAHRSETPCSFGARIIPSPRASDWQSERREYRERVQQSSGSG